ncbi:ABC transporter permease [Tardisphaera miroshnichenkoae]
MQSNFIFFLIRRIINALVTLVLLVLLVFVLIHVILPTPQAMAKVYIGSQHYTTAELNAVIERYGLNEPLYVQFFKYVVDVFTGNFGLDSLYKVPEMQLLDKFIPITLEFVLIATVLQVVIGVFAGGFAAMYRGGVPDWVIKVLYLIAWAAPVFLLATLMQFAFAYDLKILPALNMANPVLVPPKPITGYPLIDAAIEGDWTYFDSLLTHMVLPVLSIAIAGFGLTTRIMRSSAVEVFDKDYVKLAYMKGLSNGKVLFGTVFRNALIPIVTLTAIQFGFAVSGAVVIEDVFLYKGMGFFLYQSVTSMDYVAIIATTIIVGISVIIANFAADLLYAVVDPRVKLE